MHGIPLVIPTFLHMLHHRTVLTRKDIVVVKHVSVCLLGHLRSVVQMCWNSWHLKLHLLYSVYSKLGVYRDDMRVVRLRAAHPAAGDFTFFL